MFVGVLGQIASSPHASTFTFSNVKTSPPYSDFVLHPLVNMVVGVLGQKAFSPHAFTFTLHKKTLKISPPYFDSVPPADD